NIKNIRWINQRPHGIATSYTPTGTIRTRRAFSREALARAGADKGDSHDRPGPLYTWDRRAAAHGYRRGARGQRCARPAARPSQPPRTDAPGRSDRLRTGRYRAEARRYRTGDAFAAGGRSDGAAQRARP